MNKQILLVSVIDGNEINLIKTKSFVNTAKAESYFVKLIKEVFSYSASKMTDDDFEDAIDDGYFEEGKCCAYINEIVLDED